MTFISLADISFLFLKQEVMWRSQADHSPLSHMRRSAPGFISNEPETTILAQMSVSSFEAWPNGFHDLQLDLDSTTWGLVWIWICKTHWFESDSLFQSFIWDQVFVKSSWTWACQVLLSSAAFLSPFRFILIAPVTLSLHLSLCLPILLLPSVY